MTARERPRILVTGASGFVGGHLLDALRASFDGVEIFAEHVDIKDRDAVFRSVRAARPDACIHLAAITSVMAAKVDPDQAWRVNLHGALHVAQALLADNPGCHLLFASSSEIYGKSFREGRPLDETALLAPMNAYAATKAAADLALGAMAKQGSRVVRLRLFNHTGPGQAPAFVVPSFARQIARIEAGQQAPCLRVGALDTERDFLDVRDVCQAYVACLRGAAELSPGTIINIASGAQRRIGDILHELLEIAGLRVEIVIDDKRLRSSETLCAIGNAGRARQLLGWTPSIPWKQTLTDVLTYWRKRVAGDQ